MRIYIETPDTIQNPKQNPFTIPKVHEWVILVVQGFWRYSREIQKKCCILNSLDGNKHEARNIHGHCVSSWPENILVMIKAVESRLIDL